MSQDPDVTTDETFQTEEGAFGLRLVAARDAGRFADYVSRFTPVMRGFFWPWGTMRDPEEIARRTTECDDENILHLALIEEAGNKIVGYCFIRFTSDAAACIGIGLLDDYQGRGLGSRCLGALERIARQRGGLRLSLSGGVRKGNERAMRAYRKRGFRITGEMNEGKSYSMEMSIT